MKYVEQTIHYKTYLKTAMVEGLRNVFGGHPDEFLAQVKTGLEFALEPAFYPCVVVRYYPREVQNAGVGHYEILQGVPVKHALYWGDIEFQINALTSLDRDLLTDSVIQIVKMGELMSYSNNFFNRVYADKTQYPLAEYHFINIDTDRTPEFGETTSPAPWMPEDQLIYSNAIRSKLFGEFYSPIPGVTPAGFISKVQIYPYIEELESVPTGSTDPADANVPWS